MTKTKLGGDVKGQAHRTHISMLVNSYKIIVILSRILWQHCSFDARYKNCKYVGKHVDNYKYQWHSDCLGSLFDARGNQKFNFTTNKLANDTRILTSSFVY